jgi:hypothetical protein
MTTRTEILRGPCKISYNGATFYSQGDIRVEMLSTTFPIMVSHLGKADERVNEVMHKLRFVPDGRWTGLSVLFPFATATIGSSVFGADTTLTIWTRDGKKRVYKAAAVTKMPNIILASTKTLLQEVEFTCLHAVASDWSAANSLFTDSAEAYDGDTGYDVRDIITQPYRLNWLTGKTFTVVAATDLCTAADMRFHDGLRVRVTSTTTLPAGLVAATDYYVIQADRDLGTFKLSLTLGGAAVDITDTGTGTHTVTPYVWADFGSKEGTSVEFNLSLESEFNDEKGVFDMTFQNLEVMATLQPEASGMTPADITTALIHQGSGAVRGRSMGDSGSDLIISNTGVYVLLNQAALVSGNEGYGGSTRRIQAAQWRATRTFSSGTPDALFYVGTSAPA